MKNINELALRKKSLIIKKICAAILLAAAQRQFSKGIHQIAAELRRSETELLIPIEQIVSLHWSLDLVA